MKLLAFAGSSSTTSINKKLATYAASLFGNAEVEVLDLNDYELPLFSIDKEKLIGQPPAARAFYEKIEHADVLVLSVAEHNAGLTAAFKNIYDWASRQKKLVFDNKKVAMVEMEYFLMICVHSTHLFAHFDTKIIYSLLHTFYQERGCYYCYRYFQKILLMTFDIFTIITILLYYILL